MAFDQQQNRGQALAGAARVLRPHPPPGLAAARILLAVWAQRLWAKGPTLPKAITIGD